MSWETSKFVFDRLRSLQALNKTAGTVVDWLTGGPSSEGGTCDGSCPDAFFDLAAHHLPPEQPVGPAGGRPCVAHRVVLNVLWFVLATGCRWEDVAPELGCSGMTAHRRLRLWEQMGVLDRLHADLPRLLNQAGKLDPDLVIVDAVILRAFGGGEQTGKSPVDRRKKGSKHTLLVDKHGMPLAIRTAGANASDHR
jgi:transposase